MNNTNCNILVSEIHNEIDRIKVETSKELRSITIDDSKTTVKNIINNKKTFKKFIEKHNKDEHNNYLFPIETKEGKKTINTNVIISNVEDINKFSGEGINICFESGEFVLYIGEFKEGVLINGKQIEYYSDGTISSVAEHKKKKEKNNKTVVYSKKIKYYNGNIDYIIEYKTEEITKRKITKRIVYHKNEEKIQQIVDNYRDNNGIVNNGIMRIFNYHKNGNKDYVEYWIFGIYNEYESTGKLGSCTISYNNNENSIKSITYNQDKNSKPLILYDSDITKIHNSSNAKNRVIIEILKLIDKIKQIDKTIENKLIKDICSKFMDKMNETKIKVKFMDKIDNYADARSKTEKIIINNYIEIVIGELKEVLKSAVDKFTKRKLTIDRLKKRSSDKTINSNPIRLVLLNYLVDDKDKKLIVTISKGLNKLKTINNIKDISDMDLFKNNKNSKNNNNKSEEEEKELSDTLSKIKTRANEYIDCIVNYLYDNYNGADNYSISSQLSKPTSAKSNSIRDYAIFRAVNNYLKNEKKLSTTSKVLDRLYKDREINKYDNLIKHWEIWHTNDRLQKKLNVLNNKLEILEDKFVRNNREEIVNGTGNEIEKKNNLMKLKKANFDMYVKEHSLYNKLMEIDKSIEEEIRKEPWMQPVLFFRNDFVVI